MEEQLITFETAKLAKEKGFDEHVDKSICNENDGHFYHGGKNSYFERKYLHKQYSSPTQSLLQKWLREIHGIYVDIMPTTKGDDVIHVLHMCNVFSKEKTIECDLEVFEKYEDALEEGLLIGLKHI